MMKCIYLVSFDLLNNWFDVVFVHDTGERAQLLVQPSAQDADMETVTDGVKIWELQLVDFEVCYR